MPLSWLNQNALRGATDLDCEYCEPLAPDLEFVLTCERTRLAPLRTQVDEQVHTLSKSVSPSMLQSISLFRRLIAGLDALRLSCNRSCLTFIVCRVRSLGLRLPLPPMLLLLLLRPPPSRRTVMKPCSSASATTLALFPLSSDRARNPASVTSSPVIGRSPTRGRFVFDNARSARAAV